MDKNWNKTVNNNTDNNNNTQNDSGRIFNTSNKNSNRSRFQVQIPLKFCSNPTTPATTTINKFNFKSISPHTAPINHENISKLLKNSINTADTAINKVCNSNYNVIKDDCKQILNTSLKTESAIEAIVESNPINSTQLITKKGSIKQKSFTEYLKPHISTTISTETTTTLVVKRDTVQVIADADHKSKPKIMATIDSSKFKANDSENKTNESSPTTTQTSVPPPPTIKTPKPNNTINNKQNKNSNLKNNSLLKAPCSSAKNNKNDNKKDEHALNFHRISIKRVFKT